MYLVFLCTFTLEMVGEEKIFVLNEVKSCRVNDVFCTCHRSNTALNRDLGGRRSECVFLYITGR